MMQKPPNTVPVVDLPFDPQIILSKLAKAIPPLTMADNWTAYKEMAAKLAGSGGE